MDKNIINDFRQKVNSFFEKQNKNAAKLLPHFEMNISLYCFLPWAVLEEL